MNMAAFVLKHRKVLGLLVASTLLQACGDSTKFEGSSQNITNRRLQAEAVRQGSDAESAPPASAEAPPAAPMEEPTPAQMASPVAAIPDVKAPAEPAAVSSETSAVKEEKLEVVEQTFQADKNSAALAVTFESDYTEQLFLQSYDRAQVSEKKVFKQVERRLISKSFKQGSIGTAVSEDITPTAHGLVDILLVMDNSTSMSEEQAEVAIRLPDLVSELGSADWQIRIVTTDPRNGCSVAHVKKSDPNPLQAFKAAVTAIGVRGTGDERGIQTAIMGLQCPQQWIRAHSSIAVLIVSDEDNCSDGDCSFEPIANNKPETLKAVLASNLGGSSRVFGDTARVYGIFKVRQGNICMTNGKEAPIYQQLVKDSGGLFGSICDASYSLTFQEISKNIKRQLEVTYPLLNTPDLNSDVVTVDGRTLVRGTDYVLSGSSIKFLNPPPVAAKVTISYAYAGSPLVASFDLADAIGHIEGVVITSSVRSELLDPSKYRIEGTKVVFNPQPEDGAEVRIHYREKLPLLVQSFEIGKEATAASVRASINGAPVGVSYNAVQGLVELARLPRDGESIEVSYLVERQGAPRLKFAAPSLPAGHLRDLSAVDANTMAPVGVSYDGAAFVMNAADFVEGHHLKVRYRLAASEDEESFELPHAAAASDIEVRLINLAGESSLCPADKLELEAKSLSLSCTVKDLAKVEVVYPRLAASAQRFKVTGAYAAMTAWVVLVNDKETAQYKREGDELVFEERLPADAKVSVRMSVPKKG